MKTAKGIKEKEDGTITTVPTSAPRTATQFYQYTSQGGC